MNKSVDFLCHICCRCCHSKHTTNNDKTDKHQTNGLSSGCRRCKNTELSECEPWTLAARSRTPRCTSSWRFRSSESSSSRNFICAFTDVVVSYRASACKRHKTHTVRYLIQFPRHSVNNKLSCYWLTTHHIASLCNCRKNYTRCRCTRSICTVCLIIWRPRHASECRRIGDRAFSVTTQRSMEQAADSWSYCSWPVLFVVNWKLFCSILPTDTGKQTDDCFVMHPLSSVGAQSAQYKKLNHCDYI